MIGSSNASFLIKIFETLDSFIKKYTKFKFLSRFQHIYLFIYMMKGENKYGKSNISILYIGDKISLSYITKIIFFFNFLPKCLVF